MHNKTQVLSFRNGTKLVKKKKFNFLASFWSDYYVSVQQLVFSLLCSQLV